MGMDALSGGGGGSAGTHGEAFWREALLGSGSTLQSAIQNLDRTGLQIVLVVEDGNILAGTLTDGDIRRGLLRGLGMSSPVSLVINSQPLVVPPELTRDTALQIMKVNRVHQLPIVDESGSVVGLHLLEELYSSAIRDNPMVIMAGGQGVRLRPYTENCPKPLLAVGGKPMLEHIIERAKADGFSRFTIAINYLGEMIQEFFGDGSKWGVSIEYLCEREPLGTAGALGLIDPLPNKPFIVSNGDVLSDLRYGDLLEFHCRQEAVATMAVRLHEWQHPFGVVQTKGVDIVGFEEKPVFRSHVNAGIYALDPSVLESLEQGVRCDMPTLFTRLQALGKRVIVYPMHEPWLDVGRESDLLTARKSAAKRGFSD